MIRTYVINLPKDTQRRKFQENQLQRLDIPFEILKGVSAEQIDDTLAQKHRYDWERPLRKAELACFFSHRNVWRKVAKSTHPALILEDDAYLSSHISDLLLALSKTHFEFPVDLINLESVGRKKLLSKNFYRIGNFKMRKLFLDRNGAGAYILYPSGALKLLRDYERLGVALSDAHMRHCKDLHAYQIEPIVSVQFSECEKLGITSPIQTSSNISPLPKPPKRLWERPYFFAKRLYAQLRQGSILLRNLPFATKRCVAVNPADFVKGEDHEAR